MKLCYESCAGNLENKSSKCISRFFGLPITILSKQFKAGWKYGAKNAGNTVEEVITARVNFNRYEGGKGAFWGSPF